MSQIYEEFVIPGEEEEEGEITDSEEHLDEEEKISDEEEREHNEENNNNTETNKFSETVSKVLSNVERRISGDRETSEGEESEPNRSSKSSASSSASERRSRHKHKAKKNKKRNYSRSRSSSRENKKRKHRDRSSSSSSSSSRATFEDYAITHPKDDDRPYICKICKRSFYTIKELAEHDIRAHDGELDCTSCDKKSISVSKLAAHMLFRHPDRRISCAYCNGNYSKGTAEEASNTDWEEFRAHVYKEVLKRKMYHISERYSSSHPHGDAVALRGIGKCPHGPAMRCKNFPTCPGSKCIYSHGPCRYDITCNKPTCPFDHKNRPRTCMACVQDIKHFQMEKRRKYQS